MTVTLVLGGARSGKSLFAEKLVLSDDRRPLYIATAQAGDEEMRARIDHHRDRRGDRWKTIEEHLDLAGAILRYAAPDRHILVDCLTLWLSNLMLVKQDIETASHNLISALSGASGPVTLVSNETGLGIVPANALARDFRDEAGRLNQTLAAAADNVYFMLAGLPMALKKEGTVTATGLPQDPQEADS